MRPEGPRDPLAGPDAGPEAPFPVKLWGPVVRGFGRGSKELGIPTANIPPEGLSATPDIETGVYYGFVGLSSASNPNSETEATYPAVLSIGYNPFYKNTVRSVEIHILHEFRHDFYGAALNLLMLGFIRPELDYVSKEKLIEDIKTDCDVALNSLKREAYQSYEHDAWLRDFKWTADVDTKQVESELLGSGDKQ